SEASRADITVLDFFAGSGSTAHAVIHLNRSDNGRRRYILVESSESLDALLRTRIQRVVYTTKWKHGRPLARDGIRHAFKYLRLEPCEDPLPERNAPLAEGEPWTLAHVETFNHLLGLRVHRMRNDEAAGIRWVEGTTPAGERVLVAWRKPRSHPKTDEARLLTWLEHRRSEGRPFDIIYTNAANELKTRRGAGENWEIRRIEEHFHRLVFEALAM
ncbi:MAG: site-specific DNA-methyltransferase, partial [Phycisphaerae bacterium]|nr:site-specific DNA-methyltransferase [Phycisphaerae bacterium]